MMITSAAATALCPGVDGAERIDRHGVLTVERFLPKALCQQLVELAKHQPSEEGRVLADGADAGRNVYRASAVRVTSTIKTFAIGDHTVPLVARAMFDCVEPHYATRIAWFEFPDILRYDAGGHYGAHNDSEVWDEGAAEWRLAEDRQYSLLIYLNDDFSGGALRFDELDLTIQPTPGMLVAFPSDHRFVHTALAVESGTRYAVVSWGAAVGAPRVHQGATLGVVYTAPAYLPPRLGQLL